jgi:hypothetical protein
LLAHPVIVFDEPFIDPVAAIVAAPYRSPDEPSGDRAAGDDYLPKVPALGPCRTGRQIEHLKIFLVLSNHVRLQSSNNAARRNVIAWQLCRVDPDDGQCPVISTLQVAAFAAMADCS